MGLQGSARQDQLSDHGGCLRLTRDCLIDIEEEGDAGCDRALAGAIAAGLDPDDADIMLGCAVRFLAGEPWLKASLNRAEFFDAFGASG